jgi:hypothetical protein
MCVHACVSVCVYLCVCVLVLRTGATFVAELLGVDPTKFMNGIITRSMTQRNETITSPLNLAQVGGLGGPHSMLHGLAC